MQATEIQRLAAMGSALRPDWPARSLLTFLTKHFETRAYGDVAVALSWVATRTKTETPRLLLEAGPWWKAAATEGAHVPRPPRKSEECPTHPGQWANNCHGCAADRLAGTTTLPAEPRRPDRSDHTARLRAELQTARADLCPCGVKPSTCAAHDPRRNPEPETEEPK